MVSAVGWDEGEPYTQVFLSTTLLYREIASRQRVLSVINVEDRDLLENEGLIAAPIYDPEGGEVFGMIKIESIPFLQLKVTTIETLKLIGEWIGKAYSNRVSYDRAKEGSLLNPQTLLFSPTFSIIAKIEREFELKKKELLENLEKEPNKPSYLLALAQHLDAYAFSGVIDFFREKESREMAIIYYQKYIDQRPDDHQAWVALGRLLNRLHAFEQVMEWFEKRMRSDSSIPANSYVWYWEALYMLQSYQKLSDSAQKVYTEMAKTNLQQDLLECVKLWVKRT